MLDLVNIKEVTNTNEIVKLLIPEKNNTYDIYVPKSTQQFFSERQDIAHDYALAAFAGQKLKEICKTFEYNIVPPDVHESILFTLAGIDKMTLAGIVLELSYYYGLNDNDNEDEFLLDDVYQFIDDIEEKKIVPACPIFIEYYNQFNKEEDDDE